MVALESLAVFLVVLSEALGQGCLKPLRFNESVLKLQFACGGFPGGAHPRRVSALIRVGREVREKTAAVWELLVFKGRAGRRSSFSRLQVMTRRGVTFRIVGIILTFSTLVSSFY